MQIGSRWRAGSAPHVSVPEQLHLALAQVDADGKALSWTLTWLEGRPVCRRSDDITVTLTSTGDVKITHAEEQATTDSGTAPHDDDDDDWLLE